ncbi:MAG: EAL domain-containing protein [Gammaproteobacteria bacterium]|nr:EAL domain-containing protein [Gammaproteobacteria bacterium]
MFQRRFTSNVFFYFLLVITPLVSFGAKSWSQSKTNLSQDISFSNLDVANHLPHSTVNAIAQDEQGFIWFATQNGISRFSGKNSKLYIHQPGNEFSLSNNWIWDIHSDSEGRLWAASYGGFHLYVPESDSWINYSKSLGSENVAGDSYVAITEDHQGNIWFASYFSGLTKLNTSTGTFSNINTDHKYGLNSNDLTDIAFNQRGHMWVATADNGINFKTIEDSKFTYLTKSSVYNLPSNTIRKLKLDRSNNLWVATEDAGVFVLKNNKLVQHYQYSATSNSICSNYVYDILHTNQDTVWFATIDGLCKLDNSNGKFSLYQHQENNPSSLINNRVQTLLQDKGGVIWAGTHSGVSRWNASLSYFAQINNVTLADSLNSQSVMAISGTDNDIYVGTWGGGLNKFTLDKEQLRASELPEALQNLNEENIMSLLVEDSHDIWIGSFNSGLYYYNSETATITSYMQGKHQSALSSNKISKIIRLENGQLAIATYGGGLNLFDQTNQTFAQIDHKIHHDKDSIGIYIADITEDDGNIWIASSDSGLLKYDISTKQLSEPLANNKSLAESFGHEVFSVLATDSYLWLSGSNGIARIDKTTLTTDQISYTHIGSKQGLASNFIYSLLEDQHGYIWFSHGKGISRLHQESFDVVNFNRSHGLQGSDFNSSAFYKDDNGRMYFGGTNGFNTFTPDNLPINSYKPDIKLTQFRLANEVVPIDKMLSADGFLELKYNQSIIDFEFVALDYTQPENNRYQYKVNGLNDVWHDLGTTNLVSFSFLEDGEYQLKIKGSNNDKVWSDELTIPIRVLPPLWRSWMAYTVYLLFIAITSALWLRQLKIKRLRQIAHQKRLHKLAYFDNLTGLPNRQSFYEKLKTYIDDNIKLSESHERSITRDLEAAVMVIDLDRFKRINDTLGHDFGDELLLEVTKRLTDSIQAVTHHEWTENNLKISGKLARLGGDEFAILFEYVESKKQITRIVQQLIERISAPIQVENYEITVTPSVGITLFPENGESASELIKQADIAMYQAKEVGRNSYVFFHEEHNDRSIERLRLEEYLHSAIKNQEFELHYQPQVNIKQNKVTKAEALIRWNNPQIGFVSPVDFIPVAEETGLIIEIGDWVLNTACLEAKKWQTSGLDNCKVSINVSSIQFKQSDLIRKIESALKTSGLPAHLLEIEITESAIMSDVEDNIKRLKDLKAMGISIACDDFGTGYSSLSYLKRFPLDTLKIDRSFINDVATDDNDLAIVKAIMLLADTMQLKVVAEGVETMEQLQIMNKYHCELIQGYFFSKPLKYQEFVTFVNDEFYQDKFLWELELLGK